MSSGAGEKTFDATPERRKRFRNEGRFARARDAGGILATSAVIGVLAGSRGAIGRALDVLFARTLGDLDAYARAGPTEAISTAATALVALAAPAAVAAAAGATVMGFVQAGVHLNTDPLSPDLSRLNPLPKLQQLFSPKKGTIEALLGVLRIAVVGYVTYRVLLLELPALLSLTKVPVVVGATIIIDVVLRVTLSALATLAVIAVVDYGQSWFLLEREMKMSRQEVIDDSRAQDGDPKAKNRMKQRARAIARKRALSNVKSADVIVTNPTHVAVALRYGKDDAAPVVVAKGHDDLAMQIRKEARKHGIPILENRPLARALDAAVPLGHAIPAVHFAAVARILAFVYRVRQRGTRRA